MQVHPSKNTTTIYWITTALLCFGMVAGAIAQLSRFSFNVQGIIQLGFPVYVLSIIGLWKLAGAVVLLLPGLALIKEWAYAGFFFLLTSAVASHIACGESMGNWIGPLIFALLTIASWYFRPTSRRLRLSR